MTPHEQEAVSIMETCLTRTEKIIHSLHDVQDRLKLTVEGQLNAAKDLLSFIEKRIAGLTGQRRGYEFTGETRRVLNQITGEYVDVPVHENGSIFPCPIPLYKVVYAPWHTNPKQFEKDYIEYFKDKYGFAPPHLMRNLNEN